MTGIYPAPILDKAGETQVNNLFTVWYNCWISYLTWQCLHSLVIFQQLLLKYIDNHNLVTSQWTTGIAQLYIDLVKPRWNNIHIDTICLLSLRGQLEFIYSPLIMRLWIWFQHTCHRQPQREEMEDIMPSRTLWRVWHIFLSRASQDAAKHQKWLMASAPNT